MNNVNDVKYSFIVPIYNVELYLRECVDSLLVQNSIFPFEIVLIDDGSTDQSGKIAEEYANAYDNVRLVQKENGGLSSARNAGIRIASGEWIIFVDSDDYLKDSFLQEVDALITVLSQDEVIVVDSLHLYEDGTSYIENGLKPLERRTGNIMNDVLPMSCGKVFSSEFIKKNNLFYQEGIYYEDMAIFPLMAVQLKDYVTVAKPLYVYRQRKTSISHDRNLDKMQDAILALESCRRRLSKREKLTECYAEFEFYVIHFALTYMCAEIIEADSSHVSARKILHYVETYFPAFQRNKYIPSMSRRNRLYLCLIIHKKFRLLHEIIRVKKVLKSRMESGRLRKLYLTYKAHAI